MKQLKGPREKTYRYKQLWSTKIKSQVLIPSIYCEIHLEIIPTLLVSCGYCNKLPYIWWLKTTEFYSLKVLGARYPKSVSLGQNQGVAGPCYLWRLHGENPFSASSSFWWRLPSLVCSHITPISASMVTLLSPYLL